LLVHRERILVPQLPNPVTTLSVDLGASGMHDTRRMSGIKRREQPFEHFLPINGLLIAHLDMC
jgi:hypothetical protein